MRVLLRTVRSLSIPYKHQYYVLVTCNVMATGPQRALNSRAA